MFLEDHCHRRQCLVELPPEYTVLDGVDDEMQSVVRTEMKYIDPHIRSIVEDEIRLKLRAASSSSPRLYHAVPQFRHRMPQCRLGRSVNCSRPLGTLQAHGGRR